MSKLILRCHTVRLSALTAAGLLRTAKASSFSNTSLLIIREGKSDRRAAKRVLRRAAGAYNGDHTMTDRVLLALGLALLALTITAVVLYAAGVVQ